eukprot:symbB.v1.2.014998.t3/scaffold1110.1/size137258/1
MGGQHLAKELKKNPSLALRLPPGLYAVLCNDEVKAALDAFTQDPILRFTTSFLQEVVAEGCKQKPSFQFDAKGQHGAPDDTPMMLVESATSSNEQSIHATLATMTDEIAKQQFGSGGPVLIILGPTASFPAHLEHLRQKRPKEMGSDPPAKRARLVQEVDDSALGA